MAAYTVEDYISFIEMGRTDKVSRTGLEMIAKAFRELEQKHDWQYMMPGYGDVTPELEDQEEVELILNNPGPAKILLIKLLKEELGFSLRHGKDLADNTPSLIMSAKPLDKAGERTTEYKHLLEIQLKLDEIKAGASLH